MNFPYLLQMMQQRISGCDWQHGDPVFLSFTTADGDLPGPQIDILHAQTQGFQQSQARPVEQQAASRGVPDMLPRRDRTSSRVSTTGSRLGFFERTTPSILSSSFSSTT